MSEDSHDLYDPWASTDSDEPVPGDYIGQRAKHEGCSREEAEVHELADMIDLSQNIDLIRKAHAMDIKLKHEIFERVVDLLARQLSKEEMVTFGCQFDGDAQLFGEILDKKLEEIAPELFGVSTLSPAAEKRAQEALREARLQSPKTYLTQEEMDAIRASRADAKSTFVDDQGNAHKTKEKK